MLKSTYTKNIFISTDQQPHPCETAVEYENGGFAKFTNFRVPLSQTMYMKKCKLKFFRCRNLFYDFTFGFNQRGEAITNGSTFAINYNSLFKFINIGGTYTITELVAKIQDEIDTLFGANSIVVSADTINRNLIFTKHPLSIYGFELDFVTPFPGPYPGATAIPNVLPTPRISASLGFFNEVYVADASNSYTVRSPRCYNFQAGSNLFLNIQPLPLGTLYGGNKGGVTYIIPLANVPYGSDIYISDNGDFEQLISDFRTPVSGFGVSLTFSDGSIAANGGHNVSILLEIEYSDNL